MDVKKSYYVDGVEFDTMDDFLRIVKCDDEEFPMELIIKSFDKPNSKYATSIDKMKKMYEKAKLMTAKDALKFPNMEQRMVAIKYAGPEKIVTELGGKLISSETVSKTHKRLTPKKSVKLDGVKPAGYEVLLEDMFDDEPVTFDDKYDLYKIDKKKLETDEDVFILHCVCPSTGRNYHIFIEPKYATKAIDAVASTLRDKEGSPLSRAEYLEMECES